MAFWFWQETYGPGLPVNMDQCDCQPNSDCTQTSAVCGDSTTGLWLDFNSVLTGTLTVVGYLVYRFSQALPALIRWPIHLFCTLTGLTPLWGWISHLVGTLRSIIPMVWKTAVVLPLFTCGLEYVMKGLSKIWRFIVGLVTSVKGCVNFVSKVKPQIRRPSSDHPSGKDTYPSPAPREPELRIILVGPPGGGRTSLAKTLLGRSLPEVVGDVTECTRQKVFVDRRELTVIDTPDLLGTSLGDRKAAREALRSLQLASPGPHAFLLVLRAPGSRHGLDQDANAATRTLLELVGWKAASHVLIVLTHADNLAPGCTLAQLLEDDVGGIRTALSLCGQSAELVDNSPELTVEERREGLARRLVKRLAEMRALKGHYTHKLQNREDCFREELLTDMASELALKLGQKH